MAEELKIGDVVQLKSGGPSMTLEEIDFTGGALCAWFEGKKVEKRTFQLTSLEKAKKPGN